MRIISISNTVFFPFHIFNVVFFKIPQNVDNESPSASNVGLNVPPCGKRKRESSHTNKIVLSQHAKTPKRIPKTNKKVNCSNRLNFECCLFEFRIFYGVRSQKKTSIFQYILFHIYLQKITTKSQNKLKVTMQHEAPINEFIINEVILATIPGYAPWPARISKIIGETIFVEFFGTGQMYEHNQIYYFNRITIYSNYIVFRNPVRSNAICRLEIPKMVPFLQRRGYKKAIMELEQVLDVPSPHLSLCA